MYEIITGRVITHARVNFLPIECSKR